MAESLIVPESVALTPSGMELPPGMPFGEWLATMGQLFTLERATWWFIGDGLSYGEKAYGEKYAQAQALSEASGIPTDSLRAAQWVAERIEPARRCPNLSWSHHRIIASLEPDEQDRLLDEAERRGWSTRELQEIRKGYQKALANPKPDTDDDLPSDPAPEDEPPEGVEPDDGAPEVDPVAEWEREAEDNRRLREQLESLQADDTTAELAKLHRRIDGLESRLHQETTRANEAQNTIGYYQRLTADLRKLLDVEDNAGIKPAVLRLVQRSTSPAPTAKPKPKPAPAPTPAPPAEPQDETAIEMFRDGARREIRTGKTLIVVGADGRHSGDHLRVVRVDRKEAGVAAWGDSERTEIGTVALDNLVWDTGRSALVASDVAWAEALAP